MLFVGCGVPRNNSGGSGAGLASDLAVLAVTPAAPFP